jgi:DinB superfamily
MALPLRLLPLLAQFDDAREELANRLVGLTDDEYLWEPVPNCWSIRPKAEGPAPLALELVGAGDWGRDRSPDDPEPAPFTTLAWRLSHITESLASRADYTIGTRSMTRYNFPCHGDAAGALAAFAAAADSWREALVSADDAALDTVGYSQYPYGGDPDEPFIDTVWWENHELLHHGAEIALLRDLCRAMRG